jgi:hypothetical protein
MAIQPTNLRTTTSVAAELRFYPDPDGIVGGLVFVPVAEAPILAQLTPLAYDTSLAGYVPWEDGGSNGRGDVRGFVSEKDGQQTHATNETLGNVMIRGKVHYDDIPAAYKGAALQAALRNPSTRSNGLLIEGLTDVRYGPDED